MTATAPAAAIDGIGFWAPGLPSWEAFLAHRRGEAVSAPAATRPAPALLPPNERRRAPDTVLVALQAAQDACAAAGRDPKRLPSVFASCHGELAITDDICRTLARAPTEVSPTRFHNSVHNAAAGYWTIGTGAHPPATALSAGPASFAMGLVDAVAQLAAGAPAVLLVGYDGAAAGPLRDVAPSQGLLGLALVLAAAGDQDRLRLRLCLDAGDGTPPAPSPEPALAGNAMAPALALLAAVADGAARAVLPAGPGATLAVRLERPA